MPDETTPIPPAPEPLEALPPSKILAGEIGIETDFLLHHLAQVFVIKQDVEGDVRYATLQWHEKQPGVDVHDFTLSLSRRQAIDFMESLRAITSNTPQAHAEQQELARLRQHSTLLQRENALLRANLDDLRPVVQSQREELSRIHHLAEQLVGG